jgi:protein-disulfide isomerase
VEYVLFVWYVLAGFALMARRPRAGALRLVFMSAAIVTGACAPIAWPGNGGAWPALCATAGALVILVAAGLSVPAGVWSLRAAREGASRLLLDTRAQTAIAVAVLGIIGGATILRAAAARMSPDEAAAKMFSRWYESRPPLRSDGLVAPGEIRVVVFTDFQCEFCASQVPEAQVLIDDMAKTAPKGVAIRFSSRDYPLDHDCNAGVGTRMHPLACAAAVAVRVAGIQAGEAAEGDLRAWFYLEGAELTLQRVQLELSRRGLLTAYRRDYDRVAQQVTDEAAVGTRLGVSGTPTFFVDGIKVPASRLQTAIAIELKKVGGSREAGR